jgi:hypothetical protein
MMAHPTSAYVIWELMAENNCDGFEALLHFIVGIIRIKVQVGW